MTIEIRNATPEDFPAIIETVSTAFLDRPDVAAVARQASGLWDHDRSWLADDGGAIVGTLRSWETEITLPGLERLPAAAVSGVTVLPTHRRRGLLRRMIDAEHAAMRERGEAMSLLYASEFPIYGRFGYGNATRWARWTIDVTRTGIVAGEGTTVALARPDETVRDELDVFYDGWRRAHPAQLRRRSFSWDFRIGLEEDAWDGRWKGWLAVHRDASGAIDGFVRYGAEGRWENHVSKGRLDVQELLAADEEAERALWAHLLATDLVGTIRAEQRPLDDRLAWRLTDPRAASVDEVGDALWVRLLDVPRALATRGYEHAGRLVLEVVDDAAPDGRMRLALDASPDGATCAATSEAADLTLPVAALGSVYLGAHDLRDVAVRTGADEHRANALADAAILFRIAREPWCATFF